jgi:hypothetical protein
LACLLVQQIKKEPKPKGQLMSNRELNKILTLINAKVKTGIVITYNHIEEQFLRNSKKYYKLCPHLTENETTPFHEPSPEMKYLKTPQVSKAKL